MKRSLSISTALLLAVAAFSCTRKNTGMDNNNNPPAPQTSVPSDTTTTMPNDTTIPSTPGTTPDSATGNSLGQPGLNCPDPSMPGYDASKVDPACPRPGTGATIPDVMPPDTTRPTPP